MEKKRGSAEGRSDSLSIPRLATQQSPSSQTLKPPSFAQNSSFHAQKGTTEVNKMFKLNHKSLVFSGDSKEESLIVQNIGKSLLKFSISVPKTKNFGINEEERSFSLSAGMQKKIVIKLLKTPNDSSCLDLVWIQTQNLSQKLELKWTKVRSAVHYQPLVDASKIEAGKSHTFLLKFQNKSPLPRHVKLSKDPVDSLQFHPETFTIKGNQALEIQVVTMPQVEGVFHHKIVVHEEGQLQPPIEIVYAAVHSIYRVQNCQGEIIRELDFGTLLKGTRKEQELWAHNSGPREVEVRLKVKIGKNIRAESSLQSPQELGVECSSTVIEATSKSIRVPPFSRRSISLVAFLAVQAKEHQLVQRLARSESLSVPLLTRLQKQQSQHQEILVCQFVEGTKTSTTHAPKPISSVVPMKVCFMLPAIRIVPSSLFLGAINAGSFVKSEICLENISKSSSSKLVLGLGKLLNSDCFMQEHTLTYRESQLLTVITKGGNLGQFKSVLTLTLNSIYHIKIPVQYEVVQSCPTLLQQQRLQMTSSSQHLSRTADLDLKNTLDFLDRTKNRNKYNVSALRNSQIKNQSSVSLFQAAHTNNSIRNSTSKNIKENVKAEDKDCLLPQRRVASHSKKYPLFVTRKIDKYQPFQDVKDSKKLHKMSRPKENLTTIVHRQPRNRKEAEEIERELRPEELKLIVIADKIVSFGRLFVKSQATADWTITNQTQGSLQVQLRDNTSDPKKAAMIAHSDWQPQIVPPQTTAKFRIALQATHCGKFESTLSYILNGSHIFQLLVTAEIELVTLTPSKTMLKMTYAEEQDLLLSQNFTLKNEGNTTANFSISQTNQRFRITPSQGNVPSGQTLQISVVQNQKHFSAIQAGESVCGKTSKALSGGSQFQQRILIKIEDGNDISMKATAQQGLADPRCQVREPKINFGCTIVSKEKTRSFQLKNLGRSVLIFQIICDEGSEFFSFDCTKGKIPAEGNKQILVTYKSSAIHNLTTSFKVLVRGGLIINVPLIAQSIAPEIGIIEPGFNFGQICCDTAVARPINIKNNSEIAVELFLDTTGTQKGTCYLKPSFWGASCQPIRQGFVPKKMANSTYGKGTGTQEQIIDNAEVEPGLHKIKVDPRSIYSFYFVFKPSKPGYFQFLLPIFLQGLIRNDSLSKMVSCLVIEPRFIVQPPVLHFKTKIINDKDNGCFHPFVEYLTLKNPTDRVLKWKLDMGGARKGNHSLTSFSSVNAFNKTRSTNKESTQSAQKSCFQIQEKRGQLQPKESVSINVCFSPLEQGTYYHKVPLYIFNEEKGVFQQQAEVRLEGEGKYPSLHFSRREVILPAVPLGIQALGMFEVFNDGYESIVLKHRFEVMDSEGNLHTSQGNFHGENGLPELSLYYPQENKLTLNKPQLILIVKFISKKALSVTCKLELFDESTDCRIYSLPLSATADNSLLTTYTYLSDPQNIYKLQALPLDQDKRRRTEETYGVWLKSNDGRNIIDRYHSHYDQLSPESFSLSCRILKRWLNTLLRQQRVREFPADIAHSPDLLLKILFKLTGRKQFENGFELELEQCRKQQKGLQSPPKLQFYDTLIRQLKQLGCLLNHIRPEFLLEHDDYVYVLSRDPGWKIYNDYYLKNQDILHRQAWLALTYQLITHFWCQRPKTQGTGRPQSNVYSHPELAVLRWTKASYESANELEEAKDRFISFGKDFKDCVAPIYCLLRYTQTAQKEKILQELHKRPITPLEFNANTKLLYQLLERHSVVPMIYEDEYQHCTDKEIFLFMHQLYELLPQLVPKGTPIIFACQLGQTVVRSIEIKNPSPKAVHYWVKVQGSKDFSAEDTQSISIEPKGVYQFSVQFRARISLEQTAFLSFFSKQEGECSTANGNAMVFELKSKITGRKSSKILDTITCPLYDSACLKVLVENNFEQSEVANFAISLIEENLDIPPVPGAKKLTQASQNSQNLESTDLKPIYQYHCDTETVRVKRGSVGAIELYFTPVRLGRARCKLIFYDPLVGEFQYEIMGNTEIPRPLQEIRIPQPLIVGKKDYLDLNLPVYNSLMLKCQTLLQQRNTDKVSRQKDKLDQTFKLQLNMDSKITQHISFPRDIQMRGAKKESAEHNKLRLDCHFLSVIKDLSLDFLLIGDARRDVQDVRRFRVGLSIQQPPLLQDIIMTTTARKLLTQSIPIDNNTLKDWKVKIQITDNEMSYFSLKQGEKCNSKEVVVRKGQYQTFNIFFQPKWTGTSSCKVSIHNTSTNEQIFLSVKGLAEDPLSEDHIHIRASTEETTMFTMQLNNPYPEKLNYRVLCDLEELQVPFQINFEPTYLLPFNIFAKSEGGSSQVGYLKFIDDEGRFFWYSVVLENATKKVREFSVELTGQVGSEIQKEIQFKNPFGKVITYKVEVPKGAGLEAKEQFSIRAHGTYQYRIKYSPERAIEQDVVLKATSHEIGVFLYKIKLKGKQQNRRKPVQLSSEVGKTAHYEIKLNNPRKVPIRVNYALTNHAFFAVDGPQMLEPGQNCSKIKFTPTSQGRQCCNIRIWGQSFPTRCLEVEGTGLAPYSIETIHFKTRLGESALEVIRFTNPNPKHNMQAVRVCLSEAAHGSFKVVGRQGQGDWVTQVKDLLVVPVEFKPCEKGYFQSVLTIQCFHYQWKYLLKGSTNFREIQRIQQQIIAVNKQQTIKRFKLEVPDYYQQPPSYFDKISIDHPDKYLLKLIRSWLKLRLNNHIEEDDEKNVTILAKFRPKKQIQEAIRLVLYNSKEEGPTLCYTVQLQVSEGTPDSTIELSINSIKPVTFELNGIGSQASSVLKMQRGHHCEAERAGDVVRLKFKPTHLLYKQGKVYTDHLIMENQFEQWNYTVQFKLQH